MDKVCETLKQEVLCKFCNNVPSRVVIYPACGHSVDCEACVSTHKPKQCSLCGCANVSSKLKVNKSLAYVYARLFGVANPDAELDASELAQRADCNRLRKRMLDKTNRPNILDKEYANVATKVIGLHHKAKHQSTLLRWCNCGFVCIPKISRKSSKLFFACPQWLSAKRKRACDVFYWGSNSQTEICKKAKLI